MHAPSLHKWHIVDLSAVFIEHHQKFAVAVLIVALIALLFGVSAHLGALRVPELGRAFDAARIVYEEGTPLSRFVDPQYAHESALREQRIANALEGLRSAMQIDRAYVAVYADIPAVDEFWAEPQVVRIVEVTVAEVAPTLERLQGLRRSHWLQAEDNARGVSWIFGPNLPKSYGMELYNESKTALGYLGIENRQKYLFEEQDIQVLRDTAGDITATLVAPLEQVKD